MEQTLNDKFLIFSNESKDDDSVAIIGRHIEEFGEIVYEKGHQIIIQQECNRLLSVYLTHFHDDYDLSDTIETIVKFIDKKRDEEDEIVKIKTTNNVVESINKKLKELRAGKLENETSSINHNIPFTSLILVALLAMIWLQQYHLTKDIHTVIYHNNPSVPHGHISSDQLESMKNTLQEIVSLQKGATKDLIILQEVVNKNHQAMRKQNELDAKDMNELFSTTNNLVKTKNEAIKSSLNTQKELLLNNQESLKEQRQLIVDVKNILINNSTCLKSLEGRLETLEEVLLNNQAYVQQQQEQQDKDLKLAFKRLEFIFEEPSTLKAQRLKAREENNMKERNIFYNQKKFEMVKKSPLMLEKLCTRLSRKSLTGDSNNYPPPLLSTEGMEAKKKELIGFLDFLQTDQTGITTETDINNKLREYFMVYWKRFVYKPSMDDRIDMRIKFKKTYLMENTIGTVHSLTYKWHGKEDFFLFAISNGRIVSWSSGSSLDSAFGSLHYNLKRYQKWTDSMKLVTDWQVPEDMMDFFTYSTNKDIFVENQK